MSYGLGNLIRSGWWAAVACVLVCVGVVLWFFLSPSLPGSSSRGDGHSVASYGFDLDTTLVPREQIVASGMPRDGLRAVHMPATLGPQEVQTRNREGRGKLLVSTDRVVGVASGGEARAYPLRLLRWHEVVNDRLGGRDIAITYNPLCDSVVVVSREVAGETLEFGVSGLLLNSNLLLYDRQPDASASSLWSQLQARAVAGPSAAAGARLEVLPCDLVTWSRWCELHPSTTVMAPLPELKRLYKRDPYHSYFGSEVLRFPVDPLPPAPGLGLKERVVAVSCGEHRQVWALSLLAEAAGSSSGSLDSTIGQTRVTLRFALEPPTIEVSPKQADCGPLAVVHAFWFAWHAAYPEATTPGPDRRVDTSLTETTVNEP